MKYRILLHGVIILGFVSLANASYSQDFFKAYRSALRNSPLNTSRKQRIEIDSAARRLKQLTDSFEKANGRSLLNADTVYIVYERQAETAFSWQYIWNNKAAAFYFYSFDVENRRVVNRKLKIDINADADVKAFNKDFRRILQNGDSADYFAYTEKHWVLDGSSVSPIRAVKANGKWTFYLFQGNNRPVAF